MQVNKNETLFPIYDLWHKPFWQTSWFYMLIISFIILLIFISLFILIKKYLRKKKKKPAWEQAIIELEALKKLISNNKISPQDFYLSLTKLIKYYLFNRFGYDLFGKTDQEVILFLEKNKFNQKLLESLQDMSESMQLIKFANASTIKEVMEKDLFKSFDLVRKTMPKE